MSRVLLWKYCKKWYTEKLLARVSELLYQNSFCFLCQKLTVCSTVTSSSNSKLNLLAETYFVIWSIAFTCRLHVLRPPCHRGWRGRGFAALWWRHGLVQYVHHFRYVLHAPRPGQMVYNLLPPDRSHPHHRGGRNHRELQLSAAEGKHFRFLSTNAITWIYLLL